MDLRIDDRIVPIGVDNKNLSMPATKEFPADAACGGAWVNRTLCQVSQTGVNASTPGDVCNAVSAKHSPYTVLIGSLTTYPTCDLRISLQVVKKRKSTSPGLGGDTPKMDTAIDLKFPMIRILHPFSAR